MSQNITRQSQQPVEKSAVSSSRRREEAEVQGWIPRKIRLLTSAATISTGYERLMQAAACVLLVTGVANGAPTPGASLRTEAATFGISANGSVNAITWNATGKNLLSSNAPAPLLSLRIAGKFHAPTTAAWDAETKTLKLLYSEPGVSATITAEARPTHVVFELKDAQPAKDIELALWGPYPLTIGDIIGEVVGVARNPEFAVGIQALNARTLGGYPARENDIESDYVEEDPGTYPNLPAELGKEQLFRGDTARRTEFGSVLQAYCRNRDQDRSIANWGHEQYLAPAFKDGGVVGSKIALFACRASKALETLGAIEVAEGLPHPLLDGVWAKVATNANCSYLIVDFSERTVGRAIEMTRRAGLNYLYHSSPFETWGHFKLKPSLFPNGWDGMRACVEQARKAGVRIGFHTLSNFITPNDPFVTPEPDPRLARIGSSTLAGEVDPESKEIAVASPDVFRKATPMNTVVIGKELVRYGSVSTAAPWRLLDCQRGAWGTQAAQHAAGDTVAKLMDHDYKVFLTDADLSQEVARNIAKLCNQAGTLQISLDGLEGNWSTGMGQYGRTLFTKAWHDALLPELRGQINDASNPGHFNWHIYTRMNWGEPWYAGFRESQTLYRFKNQLHFERNLMPHMLGWFALRPGTSIEDAEWLLARAAGFDAGFALAASLASTAQLEADPDSAEAARQFGATPLILAAIKQWETARLSGAFPPEAKARLRDNTREFHLASAGVGAWELVEIHLARATHDAVQPGLTTLTFTNLDAEQPLQWCLRSTAKQPLKGAVLEINGKQLLNLKEQTLPAGGALKYTGGAEVVAYDGTWKESARFPMASGPAKISPGAHQVTFGCEMQTNGALKLELRTSATALRIGAGSER